MTRQLTLLEREQVAQWRSQGVTRAEMGRRLGRHRGTIGRELGRNSDGENYWASSAQQKADSRRRQRRKKLDDEELNDYVRSGLVKRWSPEQIAGRSARDFPGQPGRQLSHTTIYRWIAQDGNRVHWESFLRFGRRSRKPEMRGKLVARAEIAGRPGVVEERSRFGDWEGDTIVGKQRRGGLVTLVERKSGFALVGKVQRLKAKSVGRCIKRRLAPLPQGLRHTATFDNGKEFADHVRIAKHTHIDI